MRLPLLIVVATVFSASACSINTLSVEGQTKEPDPSPTASPAPPPAKPAKLLSKLRVTERRQPDDYDRDAFGSPWSDTDGNGCNQRDDVLLRDAVPGSTTVAQQDGCDHDVLAGTWIDPYTGKTLTFDDLKNLSQAQAIQIDHVVPLAEAWASGADTWSDDERRKYANDLSELLAVDGPTNASKGDGDPAAWRPRKDYQCAYARRWIRTKYRYDLTVDPSEVNALREMLGYC
ncbi:HNH endonuclease family protein [Nocardioides humilatus]|uniref:HNH endonuclease family protein n=1 Tax=Nocardioides humilatus TaxID=2607660 RepID=UPI00165F024A|nr:HNH endonuclease family protein [Nocardioides humilatus]